MLDINRLTDAIAEQTLRSISAETGPLVARIVALEKALAARDTIPLPKDGAPGKDGIDGKDGASVSLEDVLPALQEQVRKFLEAIPLPKDGAPGKDGIDGKDGVDGIDGAPGAKGADGVGLAGALIDRDGGLILTLTNGETRPLGSVVGKDGAPGKDGTDGVGFDDLSFDYDGERTFTFRFQKGEWVVARDFVLPVVLDRGTYRHGSDYVKGDAVTYGGSVWIAQQDTGERPDGSASWRLAVKAGRAGRDAVAPAAEAKRPLKIGGGHAD